MQHEGLRIAWQYRKYFGDKRTSGAEHRGGRLIYLFPLCQFLLDNVLLFQTKQILYCLWNCCLMLMG